MSLAAISRFLTVPTAKDHSVSRWINDDIRPLPPSRRTWTTWVYVSFWAINQICLSNWQLGSSLVAVGMSVWQAVIAVIIGKSIVAMVAIANGQVGAVWHIGFPVWSRAVWGVYGAYFIIIQRIVLGLVWFGTQSYTGGLCVSAVLSAIFPTYQHMRNTLPLSANITTKHLVGWVLYNIITVPMLYVPPHRTRILFATMNTLAFFTLLGVMAWALHAAHGAGPLLSASSTLTTSTTLGWGIVSGVSTVIGNIAVGLTNQPDYSRFAHRPGDQVFGQWFSILLFGIVMPLFGCLTSSATLGLYGEALWNPPDIAARWLDTDYSATSRAGAFFAGVGMVVSQLSINTVDNAYSAAFDMSGLLPRYINIRRGCYIGLALSMALCPWQLLASASTFISVLSAYSVFLGPMCGIMIAEYWILRQGRVKLSDLYHPGTDGIFYYWHGLNPRAFAAWVVGFVTQMPGFVANINKNVSVPMGLTRLYELAFPLGFVISFLLYIGLTKLFPPVGLGEMDAVDYFDTFTPEEACRLGVTPSESQTIHGETVETEVYMADDKARRM